MLHTFTRPRSSVFKPTPLQPPLLRLLLRSSLVVHSSLPSLTPFLSVPSVASALFSTSTYSTLRHSMQQTHTNTLLVLHIIPAPQEGQVHHTLARRVHQADEQAAVPPGLEEGVRVGTVDGQQRRQKGLVRETGVDEGRQLVRLCLCSCSVAFIIKPQRYVRVYTGTCMISRV